MTYDARAVANWFIQRASRDGKQLTPMQVQKLVYIAHGWTLGLTNEPLVYDPVEAWKYGPVIRSLYREFREFGSEPIDRTATVIDGATLTEEEITIDKYEGNPAETYEILDRVWDVHGNFSGIQLSAMTHREGTPWHKTWLDMGKEIKPFYVIPQSKIRDHYQQLANEPAESR